VSRFWASCVLLTSGVPKLPRSPPGGGVLKFVPAARIGAFPRQTKPPMPTPGTALAK
jgi:hypothetical protein